jgi:hypothetical protein
MASTIAAITTGGGGVITTADASGNLSLLSGATTVVAVTSTGVAVTGTLSATGNTILGDATTDTLNVGAGGLVKDASGNVGIGTSSPGALLQINKASGAADMRLSVGGNLYANIYASSSDTTVSSVAAIPLIFGTNNTERMRIDSSGNVGIGVTSPACILDISGATGGQVKFPATQNASANANTLDDYEEGTWTPTLTNLTVGNGTVTGTYTKVGDVVTIMAEVAWGSTTSCTNVIGLGGLPFGVKSGTNFPSAYLSCSWLRQGVGWYTGSAVCSAGNASFSQLSVSGGSSVLSNANPVTWQHTDLWTFSATYKTST